MGETPLPPGEWVSVVVGAGPIVGWGLPLGQGDPGLLDGGRRPVPWPGCRVRLEQKQLFSVPKGPSDRAAGHGG
jgi:hypothetical protein